MVRGSPNTSERDNPIFSCPQHSGGLERGYPNIARSETHQENSLPTAWSLDAPRPPVSPLVGTTGTLPPGPSSVVVTHKNYTSQKVPRGAVEAEANYNSQSTSHGERGGAAPRLQPRWLAGSSSPPRRDSPSQRRVGRPARAEPRSSRRRKRWPEGRGKGPARKKQKPRKEKQQQAERL